MCFAMAKLLVDEACEAFLLNRKETAPIGSLFLKKEIIPDSCGSNLDERGVKVGRQVLKGGHTKQTTLLICC